MLCESVEYKTQSITAAGSYKDGNPYILHGEYNAAPKAPQFMLPKPKANAPGINTSFSKIERTLEQCIEASKSKHAGESLHDIVLYAATNAKHNGFTDTVILEAMRHDAQLSRHTQLVSTVKSVKGAA